MLMPAARTTPGESQGQDQEKHNAEKLVEGGLNNAYRKNVFQFDTLHTSPKKAQQQSVSHSSSPTPLTSLLANHKGW